MTSIEKASGGPIRRRLRWRHDAPCLPPVARVMAGLPCEDEPVPQIPGVISFDTRPIMRAMRQIADNVAKVTASPALMSAVRRQYDRDYIRRVVEQELREARVWLDDHVDGVYAELGLERP